jgi:hypothetical protein
VSNEIIWQERGSLGAAINSRFDSKPHGFSCKTRRNPSDEGEKASNYGGKE